MKQVGSINASKVMEGLTVQTITFESIAKLAGRCYSDFISDGKVIIQHSIPYKRSCFDMWDAKTGTHIERNHTAQNAWNAYHSEWTKRFE